MTCRQITAPLIGLVIATLLVFGAEDFYVPRSYLTGWQPHAPHMRVEFVPGCGHFLPKNARGWRFSISRERATTACARTAAPRS